MDVSMPSSPTVKAPRMTKDAIYAGKQSNTPYRYGLQTEFQGDYDGLQKKHGTYTSYANDSDADVRSAQGLTNLLDAKVHGGATGADGASLQAQLAAVKSRIGLKNSLGEAIGTNVDREKGAEDIIKGEASSALGSGIKNTRENYNGRGLLYSGMRQGGEQGVRNAVAGNMASGLANTKRDYANTMEQQKQAYAAIGQAQQAEKLQQANDTFKITSQNDIARQQAYQQLYGGVGQLGGMAYGSSQQKPAGLVNNGPSGFENNYAGTGSRDGFGGQQMRADNYDRVVG